MSFVSSPNEAIPAAAAVYSVVVPVYNSAPILPRLHRRLAAAMEGLGRPFELIFVDDASTDMSWAQLTDIARGDPRVVAMQLAHNVGQGPATLAGLRSSTGDILITLDDDLQHPPEEIPKLLARLEGSGSLDAVFGVFAVRRQSLWRRTASWLNNLVFSAVLGKPLGMRTSTFRAMQRSVLLRLLANRPEPYRSSIALRGARHIGTVCVEHASSGLPRSRYSLRKLMRASLGFFGGVSDRSRSQWVLVSMMSGLCLLALAAAGWRFFGDPDYASVALVAGLSVLGAIMLAFGFAAAAANRRVKAFRRQPPPPVIARRTIAGGREAAGILQ